MAVIYGYDQFVFGVAEAKPVCIPEGIPYRNVRVRMRHTEFATVFVRSSEGVRWFYLIDAGVVWRVSPAYEIGSNLTRREIIREARKGPDQSRARIVTAR